MEGYLYIIIIFAIVIKFSLYFCWYRACRQQRYLTTQSAYIIDTTAVSNPGFGQNNVTPCYQPLMANQESYNEIRQQPKEINITEEPPTSSGYNLDATTFPYSTDINGVTRNPASTSGPTSPGTILYSAMSSGPTKLDLEPYSYPATTGGPTSPGATAYLAGTNSEPQQI